MWMYPLAIWGFFCDFLCAAGLGKQRKGALEIRETLLFQLLILSSFLAPRTCWRLWCQMESEGGKHRQGAKGWMLEGIKWPCGQQRGMWVFSILQTKPSSAPNTQKAYLCSKRGIRCRNDSADINQTIWLHHSVINNAQCHRDVVVIEPCHYRCLFVITTLAKTLKLDMFQYC